MPLQAGTRLGVYEVLSLIGAGGMGEVYRARDTRLGREVAIKVLPADLVSDANRRRRFVQEAQAASALNHPHIITIHEIESADGNDFIVMEYVAGKSLDALIPRQGMRLNEALRIAVARRDASVRIVDDGAAVSLTGAEFFPTFSPDSPVSPQGSAALRQTRPDGRQAIGVNLLPESWILPACHQE